MSDAPVVEMWTAVLMLRLMDMQAMCVYLAGECGKRKDEKLGRRLARAAEAFGDMIKEAESVSRQQQLF